MFYDFGTPRRKIPMRERHLYTALTTFLFTVLSHIPLQYSSITHTDTLSFMAPGTLMDIGLRPFALTHILVTLGKINDYEGRKWALLLTFFITYYQSYSWTHITYFMIVAYIIAHGMNFLDVYGSISLCTILTCFDAAQYIVKHFFTKYTILFITLVTALSWLDQIHVTIPLTHIRRRTQNISMKIPLMYNSITALVMYSTVAEWIAPHTIWTVILLYPAVQYINKLLPTVQKRRGSHLVRAWAGEHYFIPGWRSKQRMATFVQRIIDRNIWHSTMYLCVLWLTGRLLFQQPTKYLLLMTTAKRYVTQRG